MYHARHHGRSCEEFLSPRCRVGLVGLVRMGLLQTLRGSYRTDLVVYSGDLRCHGHYRALTETFAKEARALCPVALPCEGTNIDRGRSASEEESPRLAGAEVWRKVSTSDPVVPEGTPHPDAVLMGARYTRFRSCRGGLRTVNRSPHSATVTSWRL